MGWVTRFYLVSECLLTKYLIAQRGRKVTLQWWPRTYHVNEGWKLMPPALGQDDRQWPPDRMTWEYSITSVKIWAQNSRSYCEETSYKPKLACNLLNPSQSWKVKERLKDRSKLEIWVTWWLRVKHGLILYPIARTATKMESLSEGYMWVFVLFNFTITLKLLQNNNYKKRQ